MSEQHKYLLLNSPGGEREAATIDSAAAIVSSVERKCGFNTNNSPSGCLIGSKHKSFLFSKLFTTTKRWENFSRWRMTDSLSVIVLNAYRTMSESMLQSLKTRRIWIFSLSKVWSGIYSMKRTTTWYESTRWRFITVGWRVVFCRVLSGCQSPTSSLRQPCGRCWWRPTFVYKHGGVRRHGRGQRHSARHEPPWWIAVRVCACTTGRWPMSHCKKLLDFNNSQPIMFWLVTILIKRSSLTRLAFLLTTGFILNPFLHVLKKKNQTSLFHSQS